MYFGYRDFGKLGQRKNHGMKFLQHRRNFIRGVYLNVNSSGKSSMTTSDDHDGDFLALFQLTQRVRKLVHHLEIDHIERRMRERDTGELAMDLDGETIGRRSWRCHVFSISAIFGNFGISSNSLRASVSPW
jgi:hypothetical protein